MTDYDKGTDSERPKILPLQLIVSAMIGGLIVVMVLARWLVASGQMSTSPNLTDILLTVLAIYSVTMVLAFAVVKKVLVKRLRGGAGGLEAEQPSPEATFELFSQIAIIGAAFTEGCGLFGAISHLLSGAWMALFFPLICIAILLVRFPTRRRLAQFIATSVGISATTPIGP